MSKYNQFLHWCPNSLCKKWIVPVVLQILMTWIHWILQYPPTPPPTPNTGGQWNFLKMFCVFKAEEKKLYNCYLDLIDNSRICWSNHETVKRMEEVI